MIQQSSLSNKRIVIVGLLLLAAIFLGLSLISFDSSDQSLFFVSALGADSSVANIFGSVGSNVAALLLFFFGDSSILLVPFLLLTACVVAGFRSFLQLWSRFLGLGFLILGSAALSSQLNTALWSGIYPGGVIGSSLSSILVAYTDVVVAYVAVLVMLAVGMVFIVRFSWVKPCAFFVKAIWGCIRIPHMLAYVQQFFVVFYRKILSFVARDSYENSGHSLEDLVHEVRQKPSQKIFEDPFWNRYGASFKVNQDEEDDYGLDEEWEIELEIDDFDEWGQDLIEDEPHQGHHDDNEVKEERFALPDKKLFPLQGSRKDDEERSRRAQERAESLAKKLAQFGIKGEVVGITIGPVVTLFEYAPASDVKVSKILSLEDDLALALEALSLRILAPIPGRPVVGFEVANTTRDIVPFADLVTSESFLKNGNKLPIVVGRDTAGDDVIGDLATMPHLLVAGSTGSGKSVALNAMLTSLLCSKTPDELKLILIDPKRLELAPYSDIAHLVFPIVTDVKKAPQVLKWAVGTMEERYDTMAKSGVRNVTEYQKKYGVEAMPYLVVVIDELADLMMTVGKEVEELIARLAQMARAAGIHMVVATQRPSVDVITGLIKVNFPSRMAFKVTSKIDSRTILDSAGAEKLLGKGDMLYIDASGMMQRVHGAYVQDSEINGVVAHIKEQREVQYQELEYLIKQAEEDEASDPLYGEVCSFVESLEEVSISLLQRKFRIGYNRSARLIDSLESRGIVLPADGGKMRKVRPKD